MQFNVPQFIDVEDKILGPLTLKQFFLFIGGGLVVIFLYYMFQLWVVFIIGIPLFLILAAVVFIKINGRSFFSYAIAWIKYWLNPRVYIWKRKNK